MRKPIILESKIKFLIVGPIVNTDGIFIRSSNVDMELIGLAHKIYRAGEDYFEDNRLKEKLESNEIGFCWGEVPVKSNLRKSKLLFCWKLNNISRYEKMEKKGYVTDEFGKFIENSFSFFKDFMFHAISDDTLEKLSTKYEASILWNISPLLLQCSSPLKKFE